MRLTEATKLHLAEDGGFIFVGASGESFRLNRSAALVLRELLHGAGPRGAIEALTREYDVPPERAEADVHGLIHNLVQRGALQNHG
jgi:hypothetical protein